MATEAESLIAQFKAGLDPDSATAMAERLTTAEAKLAAQDTTIANLKNELTQTGDALDLAQKGSDAAASIETLTKERDEAVARAETAEKQLAAKPKAATAKPVEKAPRKLGPINEDETLDRDALKEKIAAADDVEIAFSDGKKEVKGLAPIAVTGDVWRDHAVGLMLDIPIDLYGPGRGEASYSVSGYALILDGKAVAYTERDTLMINPGQHVQLTNDIHF